MMHIQIRRALGKICEDIRRNTIKGKKDYTKLEMYNMKVEKERYEIRGQVVSDVTGHV